MEQKLFAFWEYDMHPYFLGGEVVGFTSKGNVRVVGYEGYVFTPVKILPYDEGKRIYDLIQENDEVMQKRIKDINEQNKKSITMLLFGERG